MRGVVVLLTLFLLNAGGILPTLRGADPNQRYFRVIALVHLTGSGGAGDPVVPEYVVQGTATALAAQQPASATTASATTTGSSGAAASGPLAPVGAANAPMSSRPGILAWSMQKSDDGKMAIIHIVATDHHAFDALLADTRPEIRVYEIGKIPAAAIQAEMQKYRQSFDLESFQVMVQ